MILLVIIIYFIILAVLEFIFILIGRNNKKNYIKLNDLKNLKDTEINDIIISNNLIFNQCNNNINISNYIGKFYLESDYGFYINLNKWYLLESKKLYEFIMPVNIKIVKIVEKLPLTYYCNILYIENEILENKVEENKVEENKVEENKVKENKVEENKVEENKVEENKVEENTKENKVEENKVEENKVEENTKENKVEENKVEENKVEENTKENKVEENKVE